MDKIHFIGIAGSAIAPLAVMMKKKGWIVTGSEHNKVWEPARSVLKKNNILYTEEFYDLKYVREADIVIIGNSALLSNSNHPEFLEAKKFGKKMYSFPYLVQHYLTKEKSIVIAGSYGKSTITSVIAWLLEKTGKNPAFMLGGKPFNFDEGVRAVDDKDTEYSVVEGDEYISAIDFDPEPKFIYYNPVYTLITSLKWDHADVYKTEKQYIEAFKKLVSLTKKNGGKILVNARGEKTSMLEADACYAVRKIYNKKNADMQISDGTLKLCDTTYFGDITSEDSFEVYKKLANKKEALIGKFNANIIGLHNIENLLAGISMVDMATEGDYSTESLIEGVKSFKGLARRIEICGKTKKGAIIVDDFAHSPVKAKATLDALKNHYKDKKIIAIYYPRISLNQNRETLEWYAGNFDNADMVIIPRIIAKKSTNKKDRVYGKDIVEAIKKTNLNTFYIPIDEKIIETVKENTDENSIVVVMSAGDTEEIRNKLTE